MAAGVRPVAFGLAAERPLFEDAEGPLDGVVEGGFPVGEAEGGDGVFLGGFQLEGDVATVGGLHGVGGLVLRLLAGGDVDVALFEPGDNFVGVFEMGAPAVPVMIAEVVNAGGGGRWVQGFDFKPVFVKVHVKS